MPRPAARVLLINDASSVLLLEAETSSSNGVFWLCPGGGVEAGESFADAAKRELLEETGVSAEIGPWVWERRHTFVWNGVQHDQYERFFVARTTARTIAPQQSDSYVIGHRWWTLAEVESAAAGRGAVFTPRALPDLLPAIARGDYPAAPLDCGV